MRDLVYGVRKAVRRTADGRRASALARRVEELSPKGPKSWYYHLDLGHGVVVRPELRRDPHAGESNWRFLERHLPPLAGRRILDVGCNAGLYPLLMVEAGAREVVALDLDTRQAELVRERLSLARGRDYSAVRFLAGDATAIDLDALGPFDLATLFCVAYHLGAGADRVLARLARRASAVALQGNLPRLTEPKYAGRPFQELAGVEGMTALLRRHGFGRVEVVAPEGHPKPLVIGQPSGGG